MHHSRNDRYHEKSSSRRSDSRSRHDASERIKDRHRIMEKGVPSVWGESPNHERESRSVSHRSKDDNFDLKDKSRRHSREKERERSRKHKVKKHKKHKHHKHHKHSSRNRSRSTPTSKSSATRSSSSSPNVQYIDERNAKHSDSIKIEKDEKKKINNHIELVNKREEAEFSNALKRKQDTWRNDDSNSGAHSSSELDPRDFGKALLPGEGAAMAAYVTGGKRIPRRGEIGLTSDEIESFEKQGFVMSGSRHRRMEAVRLRKESQIYSAEEKRALANLDKEERARKNQKLQSYYSQIIEVKRVQQSDSKKQDI